MTNMTLINLLTPYFIVVSCGIPVVIMGYAYIAIWITLKKSRDLQSKDTNKSSDTLRSAQMNLLQTCILLMVLFVMSWLQHVILFLLLKINVITNPITIHNADHISAIILMVNNVLNPFVYTFRYKAFQNQLKKLVSRSPDDVHSQMTATSAVSKSAVST